MIPKWELFLYLVMAGLLAFTGVTASMLSENSLDAASVPSPIQTPGRADRCRATDAGGSASRLAPANGACEIRDTDSSLFSFEALP